jgi:TolA-binding protein
MLATVWGFVKAHWQVIVLCLVVGVGYGWLKHQQAGFAATLSKLNASHQTEVDQITRARADEETQHQHELQQLQTSLAQIQQQYTDAQAALAAKQTQEQQAIVKKYGDDAEGLAQLLGSKMGFTVVVPPVQP